MGTSESSSNLDGVRTFNDTHIPKQISISKYNASGNDFLIFHTFLKQDYSKLAISLCDRIRGIGADGLVVLLPSLDGSVDFIWDFYNSDGSHASMCGNATRAVAHYAYFNNLVTSVDISFQTTAGEISATVYNDIVESMMVSHKEIKPPFEELGFLWWIVDTGVPHLVAICDNLDDFSIDMARELRHKYNANVNFIKIKEESIYIRTYERGVEAETLACGTGMSAGFLWAMQNNLINKECIVYPKSNEKIFLKWYNERVYMKGKVQYSFCTNVSL